MRIGKIKIIHGKEIDPLENGFPISFFGEDADGESYWMVSDSDDLGPKEQAEFIMGIIEENERLRKELKTEKERTDMLNFGQGEKG